MIYTPLYTPTPNYVTIKYQTGEMQIDIGNMIADDSCSVSKIKSIIKLMKQSDDNFGTSCIHDCTYRIICNYNAIVDDVNRILNLITKLKEELDHAVHYGLIESYELPNYKKQIKQKTEAILKKISKNKTRADKTAEIMIKCADLSEMTTCATRKNVESAIQKLTESVKI